MSVYLDHAASAPLRPEARRAMLEVMDRFGNPSSVHSAGMEAARILRSCRERMAECLGCLPEELIFTSGGSEANALAIRGICMQESERTKILTDAPEHDSVYRNVMVFSKRCSLLPVTASGVVSVSEAKKRIDGNTRLVSVAYANNEIGTLQPMRELGLLCRDAGALLHTDAVQAVGHIPIDLRREEIDLLSLSAHKFGGPKGIGALYCRSGISLQPQLLGGGQESGRRAGTESILLLCGMVAALESALEQSRTQLCALEEKRELLERELCALGGIPNGNTEARLPGFLSIRFPGADALALVHALDLHGYCISAGSACHAADRTPSRALLAYGLTETEATETVRITFGAEQTRKQLSDFAGQVAKLLSDACIRKER